MEAQSYDDMCEMEDLSEETILKNLVNRYNKDQIFTYIGPTLLAVNPYRKITKLFNEEINSEIMENIQKGIIAASPHIYYIAGKAFNSMKNKEPKQSIIISGESGAGKT
jgi:myosin heavy subunit